MAAYPSKPTSARIIGKHEGNRGVLRAIHLQTKTALQIALCTGRMESETYERGNSGGSFEAPTGVSAFGRWTHDRCWRIPLKNSAIEARCRR